MNFFGEVRREFIARPDAAKGQIVFKWPDRNIRKLTQLTVEQDEAAVFFREGRVQGAIPAGRVTLDSSEIPFLGMLVDAASGGNLFLTELYFVSTREFPTLPFGGVVDDVVDPQTQLGVGLRVFGEYALRVVDPQTLIVNLVGTQSLDTNERITDWVREQLLKVFRTGVVSHIVANAWPILGIAAHTEEMEGETLARVQAQLAPYGIEISRLGNFTVSLSDADQATLKNFRRDVSYTQLAGGFTQYGAGAALRGIGEGAAQGGGAAGGAILGMGLGLGGLVAGAVPPAGSQPRAASSPPPAAGTIFCQRCGAPHAADARFCGGCGTALAPAPTGCPSCGTPLAFGVAFCSACGAKVRDTHP